MTSDPIIPDGANVGRASVVVVGAIAVDIIRSIDPIALEDRVDLRLGGVCHNASCALATLGVDTRLITARFGGEFGQLIAGHLAQRRVDWQPLPIDAMLPVYEAIFDQHGNLESESFTDSRALSLITRSLLDDNRKSLRAHDAILTCTDLELDALDALQEIAQEDGVAFWLLSSSLEEVDKFRLLPSKPTVIALNAQELGRLSGELPSMHDLARAAHLLRPHMAPDGAALLTFGDDGAALYDRVEEIIFYQTVEDASPDRPIVSAGDVLFGSLLSARVGGSDWDAALASSVGATTAYVTGFDGDTVRYDQLLLVSNAVPPSGVLQL